MMGFAFHEPFLHWLSVSTLQACILVIAILAVKQLLANKLTANWNFALWLLLLARMCFPFGTIDLGIADLIPAGAEQSAAEWARRDIASFDGFFGQNASSVHNEQNGDSTEARLTTAPASGSVQSTQPIWRDHSYANVRLLDLVFAVWVLGALLLLLLFLRSTIRLQRLTDREPLLKDPSTLALLETCRHQMDVHQHVRVVLTEQLSSPAVSGVLRPRILFPRSLVNSLDEITIRNIFVHELAHVKRNDVLVGWVISALQIVHWFNPLVWFAANHMRSDRELAADRLALSTLGPKETIGYGKTIVDLVSRLSKNKLKPSLTNFAGLAGVLEPQKNVENRVHSIAEFRNQATNRVALSAAVLMLLACATIPDVSFGNRDYVSGTASVSPNLTEEGHPCGPSGPLCFDGLTERIDAYLESNGKHWGEAYAFSGHVMIAKGGVPIYSRSMGYADRNNELPNGPDTSFRIGALTRQFTATAILKLREAGKLDVTDTIATHLPEYPKQNASKITIHQLLTHTSGIPNFADRPDFAELLMWPITPNELMALTWDEPLLFEPGTRHNYSTSDYIVLGAIIEAVSGMNYGDYLQKHLFEKAGLARTTFGDGLELEDRALGYTVTQEERIEPAAPIDMSVAYAAAGIRSTSNDLLRWTQALRDGTILNSESMSLLHTPDHDNYAYGWSLSDKRGHRVFWHNSAINGFMAECDRYVDDDVVALVWSNVSTFDTAEIGTLIARHLRDETFHGQEELRIARLSQKESEAISGGYVLTDEGQESLRNAHFPQDIIDTLVSIKISIENQRLVAHTIGLGKMWYFPAGPFTYFSKQPKVNMTFLFEGDSNRPSLMRIVRDGKIRLYRRDDEAASKIWRQREAVKK